MIHKIFLFCPILLIYLFSLNVSYGQSPDDSLPAGVIEQFKHGDSVYSVALSPDGKLLASAGENNVVILWNVADGKKRKVFTGPSDSVMCIVFSPDGQLLASASLDGFVRLWNVLSERRRKTFAHGGWVKSVAFSPDGKTLVSGGEDRDGSVMLWDVDASQNPLITPFPGHSGTVESVAFSPDGQFLASTSRDNTVKLWDVASLQLRKNLTTHNNVVYEVAFSPDGKIFATSSRDFTIKLWNLSTKEELHSFKAVRDRSVQAESLEFSPDGKFLAAACNDNHIRLWNVDNLQHSITLRGHRDAVISVAFSSDGRTLASGSRDRTILLWDLSHFNIVPPETLPDPNSVSDSFPKPESKKTIIVSDTKPPNIVILSPTGRVVPPDTEQLPIRGEVTDVNGISEVKVNGNEVKVAADGRFYAYVQLIGGDNEIRVTATDIYGNMDTERLTVNRPGPIDNDPPTITLDESIKPEQQSENAEFTFEGSVADDNSIGEVQVNGQEVELSWEGRFTATVQLVSGENNIRVTATDTQGNMGTIQFTVNWTPPPNPGPEIRILHLVANVMRGLQPIIIIDAESVTVSGEVRDNDGVSEVRIDGTKVLVRGENFEKLVPLNYGDNFIHITATDKLGSQSEKKILIYRPSPIRKDYALLFAVENYDHWPNLRYPISDAKKIQKDLENLYGFQTEVIKNPTKEDIFKAIRKYAEKTYEDSDQLFIFFAGHGHFDETFRVGHLVARDTKTPENDNEMLSYVSHSRVRDIIDSMSCNHIFLVLDTCYSGTFDRLISMRGSAEDLSKQKLIPADIKRILEYTTRWYLTSGQNEQVPDVSMFVHALLDALRSKGGADEILTIGEILSYMNHLDNPKPHASGFGSDEPGSDFLFFAK